MKEFKEIRDDQIRIIGQEDGPRNVSRPLRITLLVVAGIMLLGALLFLLLRRHDAARETLETPEPSYFEPVTTVPTIEMPWIGERVDSLTAGFTEIRDTTINDIPLRIYIPHNAQMTLHVGRMNKRDTTVIFAAQAADVRADNGGIVGAFVLRGKPLSWGLSKKGYCAVIDGQVTIGVAENSPLFEEATEKEGYFFRQYPLVDNGTLVDNVLKGKSIRRGICDRKGEIFMIETGTTESLHDFAQALVDLGVDQAIYLVGSTAYGWAVDKQGEYHEFGDDNYYTGRRRMPPNTSYIVWRRIR